MSKEGIAQISEKLLRKQKLMRSIKNHCLKEKACVFEFKRIGNSTFDWEEHSQVQTKNLPKGGTFRSFPGSLEPAYDQRHCCERSFGTRTFFEKGKSTFTKELTRSLATKLIKATIRKVPIYLKISSMFISQALNQFGNGSGNLNEIKGFWLIQVPISDSFWNPLALKHFGDWKTVKQWSVVIKVLRSAGGGRTTFLIRKSELTE